MTTRISIAVLALAFAAAPASGQIRSTERVRDVILDGRRTDTRTTSGGVGDIIFGRTDAERASARIPKGHLPPRGKCRVWVDGVPPGHQPPVTSCSDAERERHLYGANARVIYGNDQSFPGKGKGKVNKVDRRDADDDDDRWRFRADDRARGKAVAARQKGSGKGKKG